MEGSIRLLRSSESLRKLQSAMLHAQRKGDIGPGNAGFAGVRQEPGLVKQDVRASKPVEEASPCDGLRCSWRPQR
jgi:hypothetical protein